MNNLTIYEKEVEVIFTDDEKEIIKKLKQSYSQALKDIQRKVAKLQNEIDNLVKANVDNETLIRSKIYQLEYQQRLEAQIKGYMDVLYDRNVKDISEYLDIMYKEGFITQNYLLHRQGIDIILPINQKQLVKALEFGYNNIPLSKRLYQNIEKAQKSVIAEIQRGIASGLGIQEVAINLKNVLGVSNRKAYMIAQNEGHRVRQEAVIDSMHEAKNKGADIVKKWVATLDGKTRPVHAELDQQWQEVDDMFTCSEGEVFAPKMFGIPALDINCRCSLTSIPRYEVTHDLPSYRLDNVTKNIVEVKDYQEWYEKYYMKGTK